MIRRPRKPRKTQTRSTRLTRFLARRSVVYTILGVWIALAVTLSWCSPELALACGNWSLVLCFLLMIMTSLRPEKSSKPIRIVCRLSFCPPYGKPLFIAFAIAIYIQFGLSLFLGGVAHVEYSDSAAQYIYQTADHTRRTPISATQFYFLCISKTIAFLIGSIWVLVVNRFRRD